MYKVHSDCYNLSPPTLSAPPPYNSILNILLLLTHLLDPMSLTKIICMAMNLEIPIGDLIGTLVDIQLKTATAPSPSMISYLWVPSFPPFIG